MPEKVTFLRLTGEEREYLIPLVKKFMQSNLPLYTYIEQLMNTAFSMGIDEGKEKREDEA